MKATWSLLLLIVPFSSGCLDLPKLWTGPKPAVEAKQRPAQAEKVEGLPPGAALKPVSADQITESNAHAKAEALDEEISRDEQALPQLAASALPKTKKP